MARHYGKYTPGRGESRRYSSGMAMQGMQSPDLVVGLDHPLWNAIEPQNQNDDEAALERQIVDRTVTIDDIFALEESGDPAAFRAVGGAFLRIAEQRGLTFEADSENAEG